MTDDKTWTKEALLDEIHSIYHSHDEDSARAGIAGLLAHAREDDTWPDLVDAVRTYDGAAITHMIDSGAALEHAKSMPSDEFLHAGGAFAFGAPLRACARYLCRAARYALMSPDGRAEEYMRTPFAKTGAGEKQFVELRRSVDSVLEKYR